MADSNRVRVSYVEESSFGTAETGSNLQTLRLTGESLKHEMATTVSEELRSDRQISDIVRIGLSATGDINFELSYSSHDDFLKAALLSSAWSSAVTLTNAITISASSTDNSINDSASGFGSFAANQWIYVSGFTNSANNGFFKIESATSAKLVLKNGTLVTEAVGDPITIKMGEQITNGTTLTTYNIEKEYRDLSNIFSLFLGMAVNSISLDIPADNKITGTLSFMGSEETSATSSSGTGYDSETTTVIMTGANHVPNFMEAYSDAAIMSFSMSLNNNLRTRMQVGTLGVVSIGTGSIDLTGSLSIYFENATLYNKFINQTNTALAVAVRDGAGNGYVIEFPSVKIIDGTRSAGGLNTDVVGEFEYRAYMDADEQITIRIARFPVAEYFEGLIASTTTVTGALTI